MSETKKLNLVPINDCVLVELGTKYANFSASEGKYDTRTNGIVVAVPGWLHANKKHLEPDNATIEQLTGKKVYFEEYKEGARIKKDGKIYCFIKIEDIRGYEE